MKKITLIAMVAAVVMILAVGAVSVSAHPAFTSSCAGCHKGSALTVTAVENANDGTVASYDVSAPGAAYIAVFDAGTKINQVAGATAKFDLYDGKTYVIEAMTDVAGVSSVGTTTVSPKGTAPSVIPTSSPDASAPITTCDAAASYRGDATIHITGTDQPGGWGIAYVYYKLDGHFAHIVAKAPANLWSATGSLVVKAPASGSETHTLEVWSQDNFGNVEKWNTIAFKVNARTTMAMPISVSRTTLYRGQTVVVSGSVVKPGVKVVVLVKKPGARSYVVYKTVTASSTGKWSASFKPTLRGYTYFRATFAGDSEWLASASAYKRVYVK